MDAFLFTNVLSDASIYINVYIMLTYLSLLYGKEVNENPLTDHIL